ncbi:MAG: flagellar FliJ family protein, partial [bacterium]
KNSRNNLVLYRMQGFGKGIMAGEAINLHEHLIRTGEAVGKAESKVEEKKGVVTGARKKLLEKRRDEIAIESLKKRRFQAWLKEYYRDESRQLDDIATVKHARRKSGEQ